MHKGCRFYLLLVFAASSLIYGLIYYLGGISGPHFTILATSLMWIPGAIALLVFKLNGELLRTPGWKLKGWPYLALAFLVPPLLYIGTTAILFASGVATFPETIASVHDGMIYLASQHKLFLGSQPQSLSFFLVNVLISAIIASPLITTLTLGEELGWRAFLQPRLTNQFGLMPGVFMTGLIWGYWHFPLIWMGYNFPDYPKTGALVLMPLLSLGLAGFLAWLYIKTGSIWAPAIAHATNNASGGLLLSMQNSSGNNLPIYSVCVAAWLAVGFICLWMLSTAGTSGTDQLQKLGGTNLN